MASPPSAPASSLPRHQLLRNVPSSIGVVLNRPAAPPPLTIGLARMPRGVDEAARRGAGLDGPPAEGSGGKVHATPATATPMALVVVRLRGPVRPSSPEEGGGERGGILHAADS
ncbi:hypothetical protein PVAP13_6KG074500 [Panicum virgatum]|uniref:Uncharacterized protein n=1 Tax=Panicum virgatum TaxID=38727 RepID=A0A8T0R9M4_PANVG|nr:hypothetical protein PVAP13_6KG074500 [Panicum virgatum]